MDPLTIDLIVSDARIWTGCPQRPDAEALAASGGRIVAVGTSEEIETLRGPSTRRVSARGRRVLPGFIDSHAHLVWGGLGLGRLDLRGTDSVEAFRDRVASACADQRSGLWILGGNWNEGEWREPLLPTRSLLDPVSPDHAVFLMRSDWHVGVANSRALALAGITRETPDPPGGEIARDAAGEPTGLLKDGALRLVQAAQPATTAAAREEAVHRALRHAARLGVTSVHDVTLWEDWEILGAMKARGEMQSLRVYARTPMVEWQQQVAVLAEHGPGDAWMRLGGLKAFVDGSLGASTAFFFDPYADDPGNRGLLTDQMLPAGAFESRGIAADRAGLQLSVHAIGDRAVHLLLDAYETIERANGPRDRRLRVEHAQHMRADDIERMARMGVIASVQPYHAIDDGSWAEARVGPERCRTTCAFGSMARAGVRLALGTDWPVAPLDPLQTIYAAVTRRTLDGQHPGGWYPEQRLSLEQALRGYTIDAAFAEFAEADKGTLEPGRWADFVVLDRDIFEGPPEEIGQARVQATWVGGRCTHGDGEG